MLLPPEVWCLRPPRLEVFGLHCSNGAPSAVHMGILGALSLLWEDLTQ